MNHRRTILAHYVSRDEHVRVPVDEIEVTHPVPEYDAFWYRETRIVLTPMQKQMVADAQKAKRSK